MLDGHKADLRALGLEANPSFLVVSLKAAGASGTL